jgi:glycosyltransferase involved in cell wall biosynthesis
MSISEMTTKMGTDHSGCAAGGPRVTFFCPAYQDAPSVGRVVRRGVRALQKHCGAYEWFIVDDGSADDTGAATDALAAELPGVRAIHHEHNRGHGAALRSGFDAATLDWVGYCDGDDQYDPRDIDLFLEQIDRADIIIGRRTNYPNGIRRRLASAAFNVILRGLFDQPFRDLGCSFKLVRLDALAGVTPRTDGIFAQCEMVLRARRAGLRIVEVPIPAYPRMHGRSSSMRPRNVWLLIKDMMRLWREFYLS